MIALTNPHGASGDRGDEPAAQRCLWDQVFRKCGEIKEGLAAECSTTLCRLRLTWAGICIIRFGVCVRLGRRPLLGDGAFRNLVDDFWTLCRVEDGIKDRNETRQKLLIESWYRHGVQYSPLLCLLLVLGNGRRSSQCQAERVSASN